ncbi:MAG: hypothetical protein IJ347_01640, partial [Faecalibacterium sp.]|nr:hypothetical protein [Faecalibacterium sp.]
DALRSPEFDIAVSAAKKSTYSRLAQNENARMLYQMGVFEPANATPALALLEMMDFDGVEKVRARVAENAAHHQMMTAAAAQAALPAARITAAVPASPDAAARRAMGQ